MRDDRSEPPGPTARSESDAGAGSPVIAAADPDVEVGAASFPASDPPASWTWDVDGRPPG